jgi:hypothetical protein
MNEPTITEWRTANADSPHAESVNVLLRVVCERIETIRNMMDEAINITGSNKELWCQLDTIDRRLQTLKRDLGFPSALLPSASRASLIEGFACCPTPSAPQGDGNATDRSSLSSSTALRACAEAPQPTRVDLSGTTFALACQNITRAFAHLRDDQLCGIWPDGSALRGDHIKHLVGDLQDEAMKASARRGARHGQISRVDDCGTGV